jgi:hypothetical protein
MWVGARYQKCTLLSLSCQSVALRPSAFAGLGQLGEASGYPDRRRWSLLRFDSRVWESSRSHLFNAAALLRRRSRCHSILSFGVHCHGRYAGVVVTIGPSCCSRGLLISPSASQRAGLRACTGLLRASVQHPVRAFETDGHGGSAEPRCHFQYEAEDDLGAVHGGDLAPAPHCAHQRYHAGNPSHCHPIRQATVFTH